MANIIQTNTNNDTTCVLCSKLVITVGENVDGDVTVDEGDGGHGGVKTDDRKNVGFGRLLNSLKIKHFRDKEKCAGDDKTDGVHNVPMSLCQRCSFVADHLVNLLEEQQVLQMIINHVTKQLNELIIPEDETDDLTPQQKEECSSNLLRQLIKQKCALIIKKTPIMLVHLHRLEVSKEREHDTLPIDVLPTKSKSYHVAISNMAPLTPSVSKNSMQTESTTKCGLSGHMQLHHPTSTPTPNRRRNRTSGSKPTCLYCENSYCNQQTLLDHTTNSHLEQYFISCKSDNISVDHFRTYCVHLLNTEMSFGVRHKSVKDKQFKCGHCPYVSRSPKLIAARMHLVMSHRNILSKKLIDLQNNMKFDEIPNVSIDGSAKVNLYLSSDGTTDATKLIRPQYTCKICEARTTDPRKHKAIYHFEEFFISTKPTEMSKETFRLYCSHLLDSQFQEFKQVTVNNKSGNVVRYQCPWCSKIYCDKTSSRNHIQFAHANKARKELEALIKKLKPDELHFAKLKISNNSLSGSPPKRKRSNVGLLVVKCKVCGISLTRRGWILHVKDKHPQEFLKTVKKHKVNCPNCEKTFIHRSGLTKHFSKSKHCFQNSSQQATPTKEVPTTVKKQKCSECSVSYKSGDNLRRHKTTHHPETFFKSSISANVTQLQFKMYCERLIELEMSSTTQTFTIDGKIIFKCNFCNKSFQMKSLLRHHMVPAHREILAKKLKTLQQFKKIDAIETKAREDSGNYKSNFWACNKCPAIFSEEAALLRHKKNNCKVQNEVLKLTRPGNLEETKQLTFDDRKKHVVKNEKAAFGETHFETTSVFSCGGTKMEVDTCDNYEVLHEGESTAVAESFGIESDEQQVIHTNGIFKVDESILPD